MPTYRLDLEYYGAGFSGWQVQPGRRTVQGDLAAALEQLCPGPVRVVGAGRTDAGVHALGQVASFETPAELEPGRLLQALRGLLEPDVRVWRAGLASPGFSARSSALDRRYVYRMLRSPSALGRRLSHVLPWPVDAAAMARAAGSLVGLHDFAAFAATGGITNGSECCVESATVTADAHMVRFEILANRFLHNMVRRLSGALVEVGRGRLTPEDLRVVLDDRDRSRGGPCLPPQGLFLLEVRYPVDPLFARTAVVDGVPGTL